ncbi:MAG TPA: DUF1501 domain-containing protein, partial [Planctomycetaceae bacterium]|nr:DUF1501 domain-containing protein [Planctomycetaceae bacterium]
MRVSSLISRRNFVRLGLGLAGGQMLSPPAVTAAPVGRRRAKQVLVLFEQGGVSQIDSWDPKPQAVAEHKSPFEPVATSVPGLQFTRLLARTAPLAHKLTIVRCMTQPTPGIGNSHPKGSQYIYSGEAPGGPVEMPDISSVVAMLQGSHASHLPSNIMVPGTNEQSPATKIGFLPPAYKVFKTGGNPADPKWTVPNLGLLGVDDARFRTRTRLLDRLNIGLLGADRARDAKAMKSLMTRAIDMLTNPATRKAFNIESEPEAVRQRYGTGMRGRSYLLGRKLIESGVRFVMVDVREPQNSFRDGKPVGYGGGNNMNWDHHDAIYAKTHTNIKGGGAGRGRWGIHTWPMMGSTDQALSALIEDMDQRGLLEETLLCFVTEFGRT